MDSELRKAQELIQSLTELNKEKDMKLIQLGKKYIKLKTQLEAYKKNAMRVSGKRW